jgi:hypothetical protein
MDIHQYRLQASRPVIAQRKLTYTDQPISDDIRHRKSPIVSGVVNFFRM